MTIQIKKGDILLYYDSKKILEELVQVGEELEDEDGERRREYYHVSVVLDNKSEISINGTKVHEQHIKFNEKFDVIRLLASDSEIDVALTYIKSFIGQKYDWTLIVDDALRYLTHNWVHLPQSWIAEQENHRKICTTFTEKYLNKLGYKASKGLHESPEDLYIDFRQYLVKEDV